MRVNWFIVFTAVRFLKKTCRIALTLNTLAIVPSGIQAQQQTKNYLNFLNPFVAEFFDTKNTRDYYGSGDANGDGILTMADVTAMQSGTANYRCDVDGNGLFSTSNDRQIVTEVITGQRKGVPFDWNRTETVAQRKWIIQKYLELDDTWVYDSSKANWDCRQYSWCSLFKTNGVENATESPWWMGFGEEEGVGQQVGDKLERWKIPTYIHSSDTYSGVRHASIAVYVGSDDPTKDTPLEYENWLVYNSVTGEFDLKPGHPLINKDGKISIARNLLLKDVDSNEETYSKIYLIGFDISNGVDEVIYKRSGLVTSRPTNPVSGIENIVNPYESSSISAFPNPVSNGYDLDIVNNTGQFTKKGQLRIFDISGKLVYEEKSLTGIDNKIIIPSDKIQALKDGVYFVVYTGLQQRSAVKIVKQAP